MKKHVLAIFAMFPLNGFILTHHFTNIKSVAMENNAVSNTNADLRNKISQPQFKRKGKDVDAITSSNVLRSKQSKSIVPKETNRSLSGKLSKTVSIGKSQIPKNELSGLFKRKSFSLATLQSDATGTKEGTENMPLKIQEMAQ